MDSDSDAERPIVVQRKKEKSRRPPNNAFRQQRLKAWQPILTPRTVLPLFFSVAALFGLFGGLLIWASDTVQEILIDYTRCATDAGAEFSDMPMKNVDWSFSHHHDPDSVTQWRTWEEDDGQLMCSLKFNIPWKMGEPVLMFYRLTSFYQNHRRYVLSYDEDQLNGKRVSAADLKKRDDCKPLTLAPDGRPYYPCGLIANSIFNDTFSHPVNVDTNEVFEMSKDGVAWSTDKNRFKKTEYNNSDVVPPPNWSRRYPNGYTDDDPIPDISKWPEFQNWMRAAGLPVFSKLVLRQDHRPLEPGTYSVDIGLNFNTTLYDGKKFLLLSTRTTIGGKNLFLGVAYCVVAGLCAVLGVAFLTQHIVHPRRLGDHTYLSWNQEHTR